MDNYIGRGNDKLGRRVLTFSLPAKKTCPGATALCKSVCYALKWRYRGGTVKNALDRSLKRSRGRDFVKTVEVELSTQSDDSLFRIHPSGDLYSVAYLRKWLKIAKTASHITFLLYTRSWRKDTFRAGLAELARLPNVRVFFSCDRETGRPRNVPKGVRLAYMMVNDNDVPTWKPDLYFRDHPVRDKVVKHINGRIVCPAENGVTKITCEKCQLCFRDKSLPRFKSDKPWTLTAPSTNTSTRIPLPLLN